MPTPSKINPLRLRRVLGKADGWQAPTPAGPTGWSLDLHQTRDGVPYIAGRVIVTQAPLHPDVDGNEADLTEWLHASMSRHQRVPTYDELMLLKQAVWGPNGEAYQVHPRDEAHVNIHPYTLHLWGRADGRPVLPDFGRFGTI